MRKIMLMMLLVASIVACTSPASQNGWVKVEGNKFIDPQGNEILL